MTFNSNNAPGSGEARDEQVSAATFKEIANASGPTNIERVDDFGADPTGKVDSTAAFLAAGSGAYVPRGYYLVDTLQLNVHDYYGPGVIYTTGGQIINISDDITTIPLVQKKMMEPLYGFNDGVTNTEIYRGSQFAPQGLAFWRDPVTGEESFFISQSVGSGQDWGPDEQVRIVKIPKYDDGRIVAIDPANITPPITNSHAHLSAIKENGTLWLYSSNRAPVGTVNLGAGVGKGWSKMPWKGKNQRDSDVQSFVVFGAPGSGHRYEQYGKGCTQISTCGKYVIISAVNYSGGAGGRTLFVYDRLKVEAMANPLDAEPLFKPTSLTVMQTSGATAWQGETCDGKYIYVMWGAGAVWSRKGINIHKLTGELVRTVFFDGSGGQYTHAQLMDGDPVLGLPKSFEPEGLSVAGNQLFVTFVDYWGEPGDIVSYRGRNYHNIQSNNIGNQPNIDQLRWVRTSKAATAGEWDSTTAYAIGRTTRRSKCIYAVTPPKGDLGEQPLNSQYSFAPSVAPFPQGAGTNLHSSVPYGNPWSMKLHEEDTDTYRNALDYHFNYTFSIYDAREGANNTKRLAMRMSAMPESSWGQVIAGDGTSAGGAGILMYTTDSAVSPGELRLNSAGAASMRFTVDGATKIAITPTETVTYQPQRPLNDSTDDLGTIARRYASVRALRYNIETSSCTLSSGIGSPEGNLTAGPGSIYVARGGGANLTLWVKQSGTGNTGWAAK